MVSNNKQAGAAGLIILVVVVVVAVVGALGYVGYTQFVESDDSAEGVSDSASSEKSEKPATESKSDENLFGVKVGMTKAEVEEIHGKPASRVSGEPMDCSKTPSESVKIVGYDETCNYNNAKSDDNTLGVKYMNARCPGGFKYLRRVQIKQLYSQKTASINYNLYSKFKMLASHFSHAF